MKLLFKLLLRLLKKQLLKIWQWRKHYRFNKINKKLEKAVVSKTKKRTVLKYEIIQYITKYLKLDKDDYSKYIPYDYKTKAEIRFNVEERFGEDMRKHNVKLNSKMQLV